MSARTIATVALLAIVLNGASVSALPCGRGVRVGYAQAPQEARDVASSDFELTAREPLFRDKILPAAQRGVSKVWNGAKNQATKIMQDPGKYVDRVGTIAQGASTVIGAFGGRPQAQMGYRSYDDESLELREEELAALEELLARDPLFRDKILPAAQRGVSRVWNGAKNQATKIMQDPGKYVDRVSTIAQGASTVLGAFGGRPQYREYDDESMELRDEEIAALEELLAREPLFRDKILPAVGRGVSKVWNGAKNQATKIAQDPGKYADRVSTIAQGAGTVLGAFGGRPAAPAYYRELEDALLELRDEDLADFADWSARELDELD